MVLVRAMPLAVVRQFQFSSVTALYVTREEDALENSLAFGFSTDFLTLSMVNARKNSPLACKTYIALFAVNKTVTCLFFLGS